MTNALKLTIQPIDPLISRDSRPFGQGQGTKIRSLEWLTPSVVCGSLRTSVGKSVGSFDVQKLKSIKVRGPFLECEKSLYFPRPLDFVTDQSMSNGGSISGYAIRPKALNPEDGVTEMPLGLDPTFAQDLPEEDFKPEHVPAFWSADAMSRWLAGELAREGRFSLPSSDCLEGPAKDERVHVGICSETGASEDSLLFSTTGLDFKVKREGEKISQMSISIEVEPPEDYRETIEKKLSPLHVLGGERRLAEWRLLENTKNTIKGWTPPRISETTRLRMILATPAIFSQGWLPGWIDKGTKEGTIPGTNVKVSLVSAVIGRWVPISGWSYETGHSGPKPLRRMVPAGSVYFLKAIDAQSFDSTLFESLWLRSVCDDAQDRNDGFGAALWGTW
ncbi:MAG: type III-B CRISPR module-associated protein Cmr3 [Synergistaceae bacterium]|jgi:CRISPR-associated protein Cmr3|nr:type III-B CRISPR module-associated protein Cmr3 [Synergistaceae bacterium]